MAEQDIAQALGMLRAYPNRLTTWEKQFKGGVEHTIRVGRRLSEGRVSKLHQIADEVAKREKQNIAGSQRLQALQKREDRQRPSYWAQNITSRLLQALRVTHEQAHELTDSETELHLGIVRAIKAGKTVGNVNAEMLMKVACRLVPAWRATMEPLDADTPPDAL